MRNPVTENAPDWQSIAAQHARQRDAAMAERDALAAELAKRERVYVIGVATLADYGEHDAPTAEFQSWHIAAADPAAALACVTFGAGAEVFMREAAALLLTPNASLSERIALDSFERWCEHVAECGAWEHVAGKRGAVRAACEARTAAYLTARREEREAAAKRAAAGFAAMADAAQSFAPEDDGASFRADRASADPDAAPCNVPRDADGREVWGTRDATPGRV